MSDLREIKTDKYTIKSGHLDVGHGHRVYFEQWGNPKAETPILSFHGGPGSCYSAHHKHNFDPHKHQLIFYDQRGCGNSLPYGRWHHNKTQDLIDDAVRVLDELGVKKVHLWGGSWGSTLALIFNIQHPQKVKTNTVRGVFTGTQPEIDYLDKGQFQKFYPEVWDRFVASVPEKYADNPAKYHYQVLASSDQEAIVASSKALEELEGPLLGFDWKGYSPDYAAQEDTEYDYVPYLIYAHYLRNSCFLPKDYVIKNAHKIQNPLYIVQGRYDMCCPPVTAYRLHQAVAGSKLIMTLASHGHDPENRTALKTLITTLY